MRRTVEIFKNFDRNTQTKNEKKNELIHYCSLALTLKCLFRLILLFIQRKKNQIHINQQCVDSMLPFRTLIFKVGSGQLISEISVPKIDRKFEL